MRFVGSPLRHRVFIEEAWAAMENAALPLGDPGGVSVELRSGCQKMWRKLAFLQDKSTKTYGCFLKSWYVPPNLHPKMVIFSRKNPIVVGETHHFRKSPYVKVWMRTTGPLENTGTFPHGPR